MKEILIKKYEAVDGTQFDKQDDCLKYELIESAKVIARHCMIEPYCINCVFHEEDFDEDSNRCKLEGMPQDWNLPAYGAAKDLEKSDENKR